MPISPTPPSGANTSSSADRPLLPTSPPGTRRPPPRPALSRRRGAEPSGRCRRCVSNRPADLAVARAARGSACRCRRRARASRRGSRQSPRRGPIARGAPTIAADSAREQALRRGADAGGGKIGRRIVGAVRMMHAIDADPDRDASAALALDQDAGELVAVDQQIVRPFQHEPRRPGPGCVRRWRRAARAPRRTTARGRRVRRRRIGQQQARIEIAGLRHPGAAAPAAPRGLLVRGDPQRPALARARQRAAPRHWSSRCVS